MLQITFAEKGIKSLPKFTSKNLKSENFTMNWISHCSFPFALIWYTILNKLILLFMNWRISNFSMWLWVFLSLSQKKSPVKKTLIIENCQILMVEKNLNFILKNCLVLSNTSESCIIKTTLGKNKQKKTKFIIKADPRSLEENKNLVQRSIVPNYENNHFAIFMLNIDSLQNKIIDLTNDIYAQVSDHICVVETWLDPKTEYSMNIPGRYLLFFYQFCLPLFLFDNRL